MTNRTEEIETIVKLLRAAWLANPELRLGQLVVAAVQPTNPVPEVFHVGDGWIKSALKNLNLRQVKARS